jgi:hypothetical protein
MWCGVRQRPKLKLTHVLAVEEMEHNHNENNFSLLSKEIFQFILQFLPMKDLAKMEMALLNHILRPHFLSALDRMIIPSLKDLNFLSWVMSRNIIPQEFCQHDDDDQEEIEDASNILPRGYCPSHDNSEPKIPFIAFLLKIRNHLKSLSLDDLSEASFGALGAFPALTKVTLNTPRRLSAKTLVNFWSLNPQLQEFSMSFAKNFGSDLISALVHVCPNLKHLSLSHNHWFNDDCVVKLAQSNLNLLSLDVGNTSVQSDESIHLILNSFPNLHNLSFYECEISKEMGELSLRQIAIPSLLSDDLDIQMMGFACLTAYDNEVLPLENDTFFSIVSVLVPLLQHKNKVSISSPFVQN